MTHISALSTSSYLLELLQFLYPTEKTPTHYQTFEKMEVLTILKIPINVFKQLSLSIRFCFLGKTFLLSLVTALQLVSSNVVGLHRLLF